MRRGSPGEIRRMPRGNPTFSRKSKARKDGQPFVSRGLGKQMRGAPGADRGNGCGADRLENFLEKAATGLSESFSFENCYAARFAGFRFVRFFTHSLRCGLLISA